MNQYLGGIPVPSFTNSSEGTFGLGLEIDGGDTDEEVDCLFLDIYVPAAAVENPSLKLPVVSWFYGGDYTFGGKDQFGDIVPLYSGTGVLQESGGSIIFIASNYRVESPFLYPLRPSRL